MNFEKRLRDHKKIILENEAMLKRLQKKTSHFDALKWDKEEAERKEFLLNLNKYKQDDVKKHQNKMLKTLSTGIFNQNESSWYGGGSASYS